MPGFSFPWRSQKTSSVASPYSRGTGALHLLIDATGIQVEG
ncbi:transposase [Epibacterium sp. DP7N7-1]|nr:transposase [Epibacterium sp. DP7N7-1]